MGKIDQIHKVSLFESSKKFDLDTPNSVKSDMEGIDDITVPESSEKKELSQTGITGISDLKGAKKQLEYEDVCETDRSLRDSHLITLVPVSSEKKKLSKTGVIGIRDLKVVKKQLGYDDVCETDRRVGDSHLIESPTKSSD